MRVKGLPTPRQLSVRVDWGLAYELVLGLRMFVDTEDPTSYQAGPGWFEEVRRAAPPVLLEAIHRFSGGHEMAFGLLLGLVTEIPRPKSVAALLAHIERVDTGALRLQLLGHNLETYREGVSRETISDAARGKRAAIEELLGKAGEGRDLFEHVLALDAEEAKALLLEIVWGWHEAILGPEERAIAGVLRRDAAATRGLAARTPTERLIDLVTHGLRYGPEPGIERVILVPSLVARPWVVLSEHRSAKILCYAVDEGPETASEAPPRELIALHKALGDETRLRLLRRLRDGEVTLQELANHVGLAKSTVHAHMLALRTSGLVSVGVSDKRYSLRPEAFVEARRMLDGYLGEEGGSV